METKPKPFNIKLSDEHRAKLEAIRAAQGLRSEADAVRWLIDLEAANMAPADPAKVQAIAKAALQSLNDKLMVRPDAKPFKTRLKGEWKAP